MSTVVTKELDKRLLAYQSYATSRDWGAACTELAYIRASLPDVRANVRKRVIAELHAIEPPATSWAAVYEILTRDCRKMTRILSVGTEWLYEEVMLLLTTRITADLFLSLLSQCAHEAARRRRTEANASRQLKLIDEKLSNLSRDAHHAGDYSFAISQIRKNSGLPRHYLDTFFRRIEKAAAADSA
jgi:hypothetical protein